MNLDRASKELFRREPDERYESLQALADHCYSRKNSSSDMWKAPTDLDTYANGKLELTISGHNFRMNGWSFGQLCRLSGVSVDTVNKLSTTTARQVFKETMPRESGKPLQVFVEEDTVRSIHGTQYTRLWDADLVSVIKEFATDFQPPQKGVNGATGLYCGEQDMFCFLIDPNGWCEIDGEAFAPGFFVWNSEVGRRSLGIETFWFQAVCANHIVWDATEVVSWKRKHTANVAEGLSDIRRIIANLVEKRDERKDGFYKVIKKAMESRIEDADEALKLMRTKGVTQKLAKKAIELAQQRGAFTIFAVVDALTQLSRDMNAGDRIEADSKASKLLSLV